MPAAATGSEVQGVALWFGTVFEPEIRYKDGRKRREPTLFLPDSLSASLGEIASGRCLCRLFRDHDEGTAFCSSDGALRVSATERALCLLISGRSPDGREAINRLRASAHRRELSVDAVVNRSRSKRIRGRSVMVVESATLKGISVVRAGACPDTALTFFDPPQPVRKAPPMNARSSSGVIDNEDLVLVAIFRGEPLGTCATPQSLAALARRGLIERTGREAALRVTAAGMKRALPISRKLRGGMAAACEIGCGRAALNLVG